MLGTVIWLIESILLAILMEFIISIITNRLMNNLWVKVVLAVLLAVLTGFLMAFLKYKPFGLLIVLMIFNYKSLKAMIKEASRTHEDKSVNKRLAGGLSYSYLIIACCLAWILQTPVLRSTTSGQEAIPLWKYLFS